MKRVVDSSVFQRGILVAILVNTLSMGIEHHNQVTLRSPACLQHFDFRYYKCLYLFHYKSGQNERIQDGIGRNTVYKVN